MDANELHPTLRSLSNLDIVLASTAAWRSKILSQLGIQHHCVAPPYQEPKQEDEDLADFVKQTALGKARSVVIQFPDSLIIAADQLAQIGGETLYKPGNREGAFAQIKKLNGKQHHLICAVAVILKSKEICLAEQATLKMRHLTEKEIMNYIRIDHPISCAGAYKIESLGASLFEEITVTDPTTIVGLPGNLLLNILRQLGYSNLL